MSSQNLTVANGYPIKPPVKRDGGQPDNDAAIAHYLTLGTTLATEYSLASAFAELYGYYTAFKGMHAQAAFDEALRVLDIAIPDDFIYYTDADHG